MSRSLSLFSAIAWSLSVVFLLVLDTALAQSPAIQTAINEQIAEGCDGAGQFETQGVIQQDLTGDGLDDLILDHGFLNCQGMKLSCGMQTCTVVFYIQESGGLVKNWEVLSVGVSVDDGNPPIINLTAHGGSPAKRQWNGQTFAEPGPETLTPAAGRWQYDPSKGLAGHATIQGEHGSTLLVDCGNGGFPALFLLNARTPESATLSFEPDGAPAQSYPVNCHDDNYCSIESGYEGSLALTRALMARNTLTVTWNGRPVDRYSLTGSSAAILQMEPRGCEL